jgi:hypothetical protein
MSSSSSRERSPRAQVDIDLDAIRHNLTLLGARAPGSEVMAVVKADAYGHGALPVARAAVEAGASWLGTCSLGEALGLPGSRPACSAGWTRRTSTSRRASRRTSTSRRVRPVS